MQATATANIGRGRSDGPRRGSRCAASARRAPTQRDRSLVCSAALFVVVTCLLVGAGALPTLADRGAATAFIVGVHVGPADSLWSIARANPVPGVGTPEMVARIRSLNHLATDATLQPGDTLSIPSAGTDEGTFAMR